MNKPIKTLAVLIIEDLESDAELLVRLLKKAGYELLYEQVETAGQMRAALEKRAWDIVISDYKMPQFDGRAALKILQEMGFDIPFIVVSGTIGEETAVAMLKSGAHDYLVKGDFARLVPAVERELEQAEIRRVHRQAEKALAASESELRALFASMQDAVLVIDREGVYRKVAPTNPALLLKPASDLLGKNLRDVFPALQAENFISVIRQVLDTKQTSQIEYEILIGDRTAWFETFISPIDIDSTLWVARDVSARKQADAALRKSETRYRMLVENSPYCIHEIDLEGRIMSMNSSGLKMMGLQNEDEICGTPYLGTVSNEDVERVNNQLELALLGHATEFEFRTSNGLVLQSSLVPIKDSNDRVVYLMGQSQDVTHRRRAEQALSASEAELRALFASMRDVVLVIDRQGVYCKIAPTNHDLLVRPPGELLGKNLMDIFPTVQADFFIDTIRQVLDTKQTTQIEYELLIGDRTIWFETSISPMDEDSTLWVARDITERKQAEDALRESTTKLETLIRVSPLAIILLDTSGNVQMWNPSAEQIFGWSAQEAIGLPNPLVPTDKQDEYKALVEQIAQGKVLNNQEAVRQRKDGSLVYVSISSALVYDGVGNVAGRMAIIADITERKQAEEALAASEAKLRALVEQVPSIVYTESAETRETLYISPQVEKITSYTPAEWIKDRDMWKKMVHPEDLAALVAADERTTATHEPFHNEYRILTRYGHTIWIHNEAVMIQSQDGNPLFWQGVMYDITERKQAEELLQQSQANLLSALRVAHMGHWEFDISTQMFTFNDQYYSLHGTNAQEAGGYQMSVQTFAQHYVHPEDASTVGYAIQQAIEATNPNFQYQIEARIMRADGEPRWVTVWFRIDKDTQGQTVKMYGVNQDITERKQTEVQLRKLSRAVDQNPASIVITDLQGNIEYVNPKFSQVTGYSFTEALGQNPRILKTEHTTREEYKKMWDTITSGNVWQGELLNNKKNGETYWEFATIAPVFSEDGKITNFLALKENITERKQAEENIRQRVTELEMLYQSGLALSQLLNPKEIGQKILELLEEKLDWRNTRIRLYHPENDSLELLDFNQPGLNDEMGHREAVERFQSLITHSGEGMSGWVIQHGQPVRSGDVNHDPRYVEAYPGIRSGLYVPMRLSERIIGVISIESEQPNAFSETDERLISTLATQAASAFENARLFEETRQRVMELETLNRISLVLRAVTKQNEMLSIVLDEALAILNTSHGSIELHNRTTDTLDQVILRGWIANLTEPHPVNEGIAGKVFTSGEIYISREFASDPETRVVARSQIPLGWGGVCLPIRTTQQTLGVLCVSVPSERELNKNEIRLLSILSEMTGAALQRMQLHEQTVHRLEQLNALRAVDQAISSSRDMRLTLHVLMTHTISQLNVDAADVLLLHPGSTMLELVAGRGFHTLLLENVSLRESFAGRVILEHLPILGLTVEAARQNTIFGKIWQEEGFACYWCVPLIIKGEVKGVLEVYCRKAFSPDVEWFEFLEALAGQAAIAIDNTQLFENLQRVNMDLSLAYDATIEGWSRALDLRDRETEGHTVRVTDLTLKLARAMQVGELQLIAIRRGALLHDIGKMGVPDAILLKEGILTDEEWVLMRKHPQFAHDMLLPIAYLHDALDIPYCHHEKWDGTGYPQGLKGNQIPLAARIFAVVDVWDALTNDRPYRKKWTNQQTREHIEEQSGKHFDPQIVEVFLGNIMED